MRIFIFFPLSLSLKAAEFSPAIFDVENTGNGIVISCPKVPQLSFLLKESGLDVYLEKFENQACEFAHSYEDVFYPFRESLVALSSVSTQSKRLVNAYKSTHELFKKSIKKHPLFLCSECGFSSTSTCPLSRQKDKETCPRAQFLSKIIEQGNPAQGIIFYASGGNWFEIGAMAKLLKNGATFKKVFFIDPDNRFTFEQLQLFVREIGNDKGLTKYSIDIDVLRRIYRTIQTAYFIWSIDPTVKFYFYPSYNNYIVDSHRDESLVADALISMDSIDGAYNVATGQYINAIEMKREIAKLISTLAPAGFFALNYRLSAKDDTTALRIGKKDDNLCSCCGIPQAINKCSQCLKAVYCERACQIAHWPAHKAQCKK